jgi:hypothetical protein
MQHMMVSVSKIIYKTKTEKLKEQNETERKNQQVCCNNSRVTQKRKLNNHCTEIEIQKTMLIFTVSRILEIKRL